MRPLLVERNGARMPALAPRFQSAASAAGLAAQFERPADPSGKLSVTEPVRFEKQNSWGDTLQWGGSVVLSSDATPGFRISAFASSEDLVAFVASPLAAAVNGAALRVDGGVTPTMA